MDTDNKNRDIVAVIMAGGLGSRMNSDIPKVLHKICGIQLIVHIIIKLKTLSTMRPLKKIAVVVRDEFKDSIREAIDRFMDNSPLLTYIDQPEALGTGNALQCCIPFLSNYKNAITVVLSGDVPMFSTYSMINLTQEVNGVNMITVFLDNPTGYGRVIVTDRNEFVKIVEEKECTDVERAVKRVNCGIYAFNTEMLIRWLPFLTNENAKGEYYLTDVVGLIKNNENAEVALYTVDNDRMYEVTGVNTQQQLIDLEAIVKKKHGYKVV